MTNDQLKRMTPRERYLWFLRERHQVYLRRSRGLPWPWSDNPILQQYRFCNIHRELDATTRWFRSNYRDLHRDDPGVLLGTIIFRWFNRIQTGQLLLSSGLLDRWDHDRAVELLSACPGPIFTSAFVINAPTGMSKVRGVCKAVEMIKGVHIPKGSSLQQACTILHQYKHMGMFMAYEAVCDLYHTYLLEDAPDIYTWANLGPGCLRGIRRLYGEKVEPIHDNRTGNYGWTNSKPRIRPGEMERVAGLIPWVKDKLGFNFDMRDAEGSMCEFDKFERGLWDQGTAKKYTPPHQR